MKRQRDVQPRKLPAQARGHERVAKILDAADEVFFELGYESATTDAIARRAGASIGSVYQFFPNKAALFRALAMRYLEEIRALYLSVATEGGLDGGLDPLVERILSEFAAFHRRRPTFRQLLVTSLSVPELLAATEELHREFEKGTQVVLLSRAKRLSPERRSVIAALVVSVFTSVIWTATRGDSGFERHGLAEGKKLLVGYLAPLLKG